MHCVSGYESTHQHVPRAANLANLTILMHQENRTLGLQPQHLRWRGLDLHAETFLWLGL